VLTAGAARNEGLPGSSGHRHLTVYFKEKKGKGVVKDKLAVF